MIKAGPPVKKKTVKKIASTQPARKRNARPAKKDVAIFGALQDGLKSIGKAVARSAGKKK